MPESDANQWYTNKELFERLGDLKDNVKDLRSEMQETRVLIKQYNGLREQIEAVREENEEIREQLQAVLNQQEGRNKFLEGFRNWGGWFIALLTFLILLINQFI